MKYELWLRAAILGYPVSVFRRVVVSSTTMDRGYRDCGFVGTCAMVLVSRVPEAGLALKVHYRGSMVALSRNLRFNYSCNYFSKLPFCLSNIILGRWGRKKGLAKKVSPHLATQKQPISVVPKFNFLTLFFSGLSCSQDGTTTNGWILSFNNRLL